MTKISFLPPLRQNSIASSRNLQSDPKAVVSIPKPTTLRKSPRRQNRTSTEFESPEYLTQQWNYLNHEIKLLREVVGPLKQQTDDLQLKCERMNYTPEVAEILAKLDEARDEKKKLDENLSTIRRTFTPELLKEINIEVEELRGRFQFYNDGLNTTEYNLDIKKRQLDEIVESDNVQFMYDYTQNYNSMRKRLAELKAENDQLESDLELLLNELAEDPVEDKKVTNLKKKLKSQQHEENKKRNQLNKMRKDYEAKKNELKEQIEKNKKQKKAKMESRNWKQNLKIQEEEKEEEEEEAQDESTPKNETDITTTTYSTGYSYYDYEYSYECENPESSEEKKQKESDENDENKDGSNESDNIEGKEDDGEDDKDKSNTFGSAIHTTKSIHKNGETEICFDGFVLLDVEPELDFDYGISNIHDDDYYFNEERLQNEEDNENFIKQEEETKFSQDAQTKEAILDEQYEDQLDAEFEDEQNLKDIEERLLNEALFEDEIGENDDSEDISNEQKYKDNEEQMMDYALIEVQEEEELNEELENEVMIYKERDIKDEEEKLLEDESKEKNPFVTSMTAGVVADIQPNTLFLTLAQQIENNEDINLDELLKHL
ncbi:hypothetical protein M9Y10_001840 [Tritrichomonas musculus]|uniref:Lebercilin domain-containing protein n=1 Tax=Tritrichomonas musculus TaxID=1915356 RepID=A0ABR2L884_9EUKA